MSHMTLEPKHAAPAHLDIPLWINGTRTSSSVARFGEVTNPATGEVIRRVPLAGKEDVDLAVGAAKAAFPEWRAMPALRRARILGRFGELMSSRIEDLANIISEEHGKVLLDAIGAIQ